MLDSCSTRAPRVGRGWLDSCSGGFCGEKVFLILCSSPLAASLSTGPCSLRTARRVASRSRRDEWVQTWCFSSHAPFCADQPLAEEEEEEVENRDLPPLLCLMDEAPSSPFLSPSQVVADPSRDLQPPGRSANTLASSHPCPCRLEGGRPLPRSIGECSERRAPMNRSLALA